MLYLRCFLESIALSLLLTPLARLLAIRTGVMDQPGERRVHTAATPLLGGLALYLSFLITTIHRIPLDISFIGLLVGSTIIVIVGIIDDARELPPRVKFAGQALAALVVIAFGVRIEFLTNPFGGMIYLGKLSYPLTFLWIVAITNVVNFIDGLDGLAAGVSAIAAFSLFAVASAKGQWQVATMTLALAGAAIGFLRYNFNPARIFMGDAGAMFIGFALSTVAIIGTLKGATTIALAIPAIALGVPIVDTVFSIVRRVENGVPFYMADRGHLHHRLLAMGFSQRQAVGLIYMISGLLGISAVLVAQMRVSLSYLAVAALGIILLGLAKGAGLLEVTSKTKNKGL